MKRAREVEVENATPKRHQDDVEFATLPPVLCRIIAEYFYNYEKALAVGDRNPELFIDLCGDNRLDLIDLFPDVDQYYVDDALAETILHDYFELTVELLKRPNSTDKLTIAAGVSGSQRMVDLVYNGRPGDVVNGAVMGNHVGLMKKYLRPDTNYILLSGLAGQSNSLDIIRYLRCYRQLNCNIAADNAAKYGHWELTDKLIVWGAKNYDAIIIYCDSIQRAIRYIALGATDYYAGFIGAASNGNIALMQFYFMIAGETDWRDGYIDYIDYKNDLTLRALHVLMPTLDLNNVFSDPAMCVAIYEYAAQHGDRATRVYHNTFLQSIANVEFAHHHGPFDLTVHFTHKIMCLNFHTSGETDYTPKAIKVLKKLIELGADPAAGLLIVSEGDRAALLEAIGQKSGVPDF